MSVYHEQLAIDEEASIDEIKEAYFRKVEEAFALENTEEIFDYFYHLHKAFVFLAAKLTGSIYKSEQAAYQEIKVSQIADWENKFEDWEEQLLEDAKNLWGLKWKGFKESDFYLKSKALEPASAKVNFWSPLFLNLVNPVILSIFLGWSGLVVALAVAYITLPSWQKAFRKMFFAPISVTMQGIAYLLNQKVFWLLLLTVTNLLLFLFSTGRTFIPLIVLLAMFAGAMILGFLLPVNKISVLKPYGKLVLGLGLFPFLLNTFFSLNLTFSQPLIEETHIILRNYQMVEGDEELTTYLTLEYGVYDNYLHIRHFPTLDELEDRHAITLNIHEGFFQIPVLKSWKFQ